MKSHNLKGKILNFAQKDRVITTTEIANEFNISWNTAEKCLLELTLDNKFKRVKKAGVNLWILKFRICCQSSIDQQNSQNPPYNVLLPHINPPNSSLFCTLNPQSMMNLWILKCRMHRDNYHLSLYRYNLQRLQVMIQQNLWFQISTAILLCIYLSSKCYYH